MKGSMVLAAAALLLAAGPLAAQGVPAEAPPPGYQPAGVPPDYRPAAPSYDEQLLNVHRHFQASRAEQLRRLDERRRLESARRAPQPARRPARTKPIEEEMPAVPPDLMTPAP